MRLIHTSDLHLGKRIGEFRLYEEQRDMLAWICRICRDTEADGLVIAGDIYDRSTPPAEAVTLLDDFLSDLAAQGTKVFLISGNHDGAERVSYGGRLFAAKDIHISDLFRGEVRRVDLTDAYGDLHMYLLPFVRPVQVREAYDVPAETYTEAIQAVVERMDIREDERNVLVLHQFLTGASRSESEEIYVGGLDNVDAGVLTPFDYAALGHLHRCQRAGGENIRYSGSPLAYSFGEAKEEKGVLLVELLEKGRVETSFLPYTPLHPLRDLTGSYEELTSRAFYEEMDREAFFRVILTDREEVPDAMAKLSVIYPRIVRLEYAHFRRELPEGEYAEEEGSEPISPLQLFADFYALQNDCALSDEERTYLETMLTEWEGRV